MWRRARNEYQRIATERENTIERMTAIVRDAHKRCARGDHGFEANVACILDGLFSARESAREEGQRADAAEKERDEASVDRDAAIARAEKAVFTIP